MVKKYLIFSVLGLSFLAFTLTQVANSETVLNEEEIYVTTEDIILDIVLPTIDKRVVKEYGQDTLSGWEWKRIEGITYNDNHSYDVSVRIEILSKTSDGYKDDLVKVRISPSCDSTTINKLKCKHGFNIEIVNYKRLSL
ncbi:hypothetical protein FITA111629_04590 [Filibacter tadaridae]|uniref:DUF3888 domain-containing protein n=1 Tax=Filibacter tadaridae TaxID=2483811 RepID=A0A3P5XCR0_9BACL|nr:hypothetical protein [Filibacter tadaridae]VDC32486.1 hypothetical protein FILTAD_02714 [Filibacter tadaridae]